MTAEKSRPSPRSVARFQITRGQAVLALISIFAILALGFSSIASSRATIKQAKVLSDVETPAASIIFTQRETLVYAVRLAQWANGGTARRNVQIARNLLAQRLEVIDTSGRTMGSRAPASYWAALKKSDDIIASAPMGILPENLHTKYNAEIGPVTDAILAEARSFVVSYQRIFDQKMVNSAKATANHDQKNLIFFYIFLIAGGLFLFLNVRTNFKTFQVARKALEEEQLQLDITIEELKKVQASLQELQDLDVAKSAFISTVNHELRTPLTSIIGYLDFIHDQKLVENNPALQGYLKVLERNAQILLDLVESMLSLSKLDAASGKLAEDKVSLNQVLDNALFVMKPVSEQSNIAINFSAEEELFVEGDSGQLNQVYINLLANAIKFSPKDSTIEIVLDISKNVEGREYARVRVIDHGIGIPEEDLDNLFTRFFRAKNADSGQFPGTGLGLSIVQQIVKRHDGVVSVASQLGEGTTFTVEIPLYLSVEEKMIYERRGEVLARAISTLGAATPETLKAVAHEIGGAIGFYRFETLGKMILDSSRAYEDTPLSQEEFEQEKDRLMQAMKDQQEQMQNG